MGEQIRFRELKSRRPSMDLVRTLTGCVIRCEVAKTIQEVQYEPLRVSFAMEGTIPEGQDIEATAKELRAFVTDQVNKQIDSRLA